MANGRNWANEDHVETYIDENRMTRQEHEQMTELIKLEELPDLTEYKPDSVDLVPDYWTPEAEGETRRMFFWRVSVQRVADFNDAEKDTDLECAVFVQPIDGGHRTVVNGSKRMVAAVADLPTGTPVEIKYLGKAKNKQNSNMSDRWSIVTLAKAGA